MIGNGKVFISHSHRDNEICRELAETLKSCGVDCWIDLNNLEAGDNISQSIQNAIRERDVFLRVCTTAIQIRPFYPNLERDMLLALMAKDAETGIQAKRAIICLIFDATYQPQLVELPFLFIDATQSGWQAKLFGALIDPSVLPPGPHPKPRLEPHPRS
ncbi:MAG: toll/interleukin-1 receptor domain-containing protein, partial [Ktedonobacterales bacterium]